MMDDCAKRRSGAMDNVELVASLSSNNKRRKVDSSIVKQNVVSSASPTSSSRSSIDLNEKANDFETDFSVFIVKAFSKESMTTTQSSNKEIMKSLNSPNKMKKKSTSTTSTMAGVTPPMAEIEDFFSVAEKYDQKLFAQKYNYDIVKDVPLEGRYQWMKLKP
ncbi:hypothetical protein LIER_30470 [Lithospermum erythrorhizon]|uniref:Cyclin-dependent kinase inhibitor domain-containing protein n=1 Tax=Lithospermum erythrorhizon TaxID=34254 RepID=A0AAV3RR17_LITER